MISRREYCLDCVSLCSVETPETVTTIGSHAFGYQLDAESQTGLVTLPYFSILCYADTAAEQYAAENGFSVQILDPICTTATTETTPPIETTSSDVWEETTTIFRISLSRRPPPHWVAWIPVKRRQEVQQQKKPVRQPPPQKQAPSPQN